MIREPLSFERSTRCPACRASVTVEYKAEPPRPLGIPAQKFKCPACGYFHEWPEFASVEIQDIWIPREDAGE